MTETYGNCGFLGFPDVRLESFGPPDLDNCCNVCLISHATGWVVACHPPYHTFDSLEISLHPAISCSFIYRISLPRLKQVEGCVGGEAFRRVKGS